MTHTPPLPRVRLLLIDDHGLFREGLSRLLKENAGLELIAQGSTLADAMQALEQPIDLILLDFDLGDHNGLAVLQAARARGFAGKVLMLTAGMSGIDTARALEAGASGIFLKHSPPSELLHAIEQVMAGESWLDQAAVQSLVSAASGKHGRGATLTLSVRERAVLRGVFEGRSNKEIAAELTFSEGYVKAVLQQLFAKTGVRSRAQLVRIALENRHEYGVELG